MTVPFKQIPSNLRVPLFYAEVDNSQANTNERTFRALIMGQITATGTGIANAPVLINGENDAISLGGVGSMLHLMVKAYRKRDAFGELWVVPLSDNGAGVAAAGSVVFTAAATAAGTLNFYIGGENVQIPAVPTQTVAQLATALAAAINANLYLPVTASAATATVTITAKNKGLAGNTIDLRFNYRGSAAGEALPAGLAATITQMASGATNPVLTTALATLSVQSYDAIVTPYSDSTSLTAISAYLNDISGTWSWQQQIYGHHFTAFRDTFSNIVTKTSALNDQHTSIMGYFDSPTPDFVLAADFGAAALSSLRVDPALPLQTVALASFLAPPLASRFSLSQRNTLLFNGCSTYSVLPDGTPALENVITTYQKNSFGQADNSYLSVETMFTLVAVLLRLRGVVTSRYARVKLANDGTKYAPGSAIVTPNVIRGDLIAEYISMERDGLVENTDGFARALIVERDASNPNRVNVLWPGDLINQLRIFALLAQFRA